MFKLALYLLAGLFVTLAVAYLIQLSINHFTTVDVWLFLVGVPFLYALWTLAVVYARYHRPRPPL
jgi:hypothetical protein